MGGRYCAINSPLDTFANFVVSYCSCAIPTAYVFRHIPPREGNTSIPFPTNQQCGALLFPLLSILNKSLNIQISYRWFEVPWGSCATVMAMLAIVSESAARTSFTRWRSGCSQSTFTSQWLSRKVSTSPEAASAPSTRERIKPEVHQVKRGTVYYGSLLVSLKNIFLHKKTSLQKYFFYIKIFFRKEHFSLQGIFLRQPV